RSAGGCPPATDATKNGRPVLPPPTIPGRGPRITRRSAGLGRSSQLRDRFGCTSIIVAHPLAVHLPSAWCSDLASACAGSLYRPPSPDLTSSFSGRRSVNTLRLRRAIDGAS